MKILDLEIEKIKPYQQNAKIHTDEQIENVAVSIKKYGFQQPLVVSKNYELIIGHCRLLAAKALGLKTVPVVVADKLTDKQVNELRIVDNKTNESVWDFDFLGLELEDLDLSDFQFDFGIVSPDDYGEDFELPSNDKSNMEQITFTLTSEQMAVVKGTLEEVVVDESENMYGNTNKNGNAIYEVCRQWAEQKK